jgi:hypothetical protein
VLVEGGQRTGHGLLAGDTVGAIDTASGRLVPAVHAPGLLDRLAVTNRAIWAIADDSGTLSRIGTARRRVTSVVAAGGAPRDVVAGVGSLWTIDERRRQLLEISPDYHSVIARAAPASARAERVAAGPLV